jgi:hypothetical protein
MNAGSDQQRLVAALHHLAAGRWDEAHELVQSANDAGSCRVHALLHRIEGDEFNAGYWYRRAGVAMPSCDTETELRGLLNEFAVS